MEAMAMEKMAAMVPMAREAKTDRMAAMVVMAAQAILEMVAMEETAETRIRVHTNIDESGKDQTSWPIKHSGNQGLRFFQIQ